MGKIRKFSLQLGLELMTTRMIDEDETTEDGILDILVLSEKPEKVGR